MLILAIRTDKPEAELALFDDATRMATKTWQAHRQLAETIHAEIVELLKTNGKTLYDLNGIACFAGPGSFTGLRIGLAVANALAYALDISIVATGGEDWAQKATSELRSGKNAIVAVPDYGAPVHITMQKK
ncbi:MAG TPA: tRNA (adenosine(37)-N6)-threonylcarbamoyltransferase complex dimerization subunit type 1 TsaB [Candidatus Saccharimonadales bacterium]